MSTLVVDPPVGGVDNDQELYGLTGPGDATAIGNALHVNPSHLASQTPRRSRPRQSGLVDDVYGNPILRDRATEYALAELRAAAKRTLKERIGVVLTAAEVDEQSGLDRGSVLTSTAQADRRDLIAFRTRDGVLVFPEWQFHRDPYGLVPLDPVTTLWRSLPHDSWIPDLDLVVWMRTRFTDLNGDTPVERAIVTGPNRDAGLQRVLARLQNRAA